MPPRSNGPQHVLHVNLSRGRGHYRSRYDGYWGSALDKAPARAGVHDHDAARRVLRAGRIRPDRAGQDALVGAHGAGGRRSAALWLVGIAGASAMATGGALWVASALWQRPQASPALTAIVPAPQSLAPMPVIAQAPVPAMLDLPSPPGFLAGADLSPETSEIVPTSAHAQEPMQIQIGRTQMRVRAMRVQDGEHPRSAPFIGLHVINLTGGALDIQRGDALLGSCADGPQGSLSAVTQSLRLEQDCILRLRKGAIHKVLLEDAPRDD